MKRWAVLIVAVYFLALVVLAVPALLVAFGFDTKMLELLGEWGVWAWFGVMALAQAALLLVPVGTIQGRPKARRKLMVPILVSSFFITVMLVTAAISVFLAVYGDKGPGPSEPVSRMDDGTFWVAFWIITAAMWIFWGILFYRFSRRTDPDALTSRLMRWLLVGSALELLVAVPSHIIVRQRGDCCAPAVTFFGIATGIAVMLMSFGPGVLLLYAQRIERLRGGKVCRKCGYDLRATPERCPECGTVVIRVKSDVQAGK